MMGARRGHYDKRDRRVSPTGGAYVRHDPFWAKAKDEGFAARSVYKLQEIDREHRILAAGARILDLGCAPGSWMQWAAQKVGPSGRVLGVDLEAVTVRLPPHVQTVRMDMTLLTPELLPDALKPLDVVLSDLAPHTTGVRSVDQARAFDLSARAVLLADRLLRPGGSVLVKTFEGADTKRLADAIRLRYELGKIIRPKATRKTSFEVYLMGKGYRGVAAGSKDPLEVL